MQNFSAGLWPHQAKTVSSVKRLWKRGRRSVLVVAPTGSGKTTIGTALTAGKVLWVAHRRELVGQARAALDLVVGPQNVGVLMPGYLPNPGARIQVASVDTLLSRGCPDDVQLLVLDEAHHYTAESYRSVVELYPNSLVLGLTATPERESGAPLGDIFEEMVVAARVSDLIRMGVLVDVDVVRPTEYLGNDLAMDPLEAWLKFAVRHEAWEGCSRAVPQSDGRKSRVNGDLSQTVLYLSRIIGYLSGTQQRHCEAFNVATGDAVSSCRRCARQQRHCEAFNVATTSHAPTRREIGPAKALRGLQRRNGMYAGPSAMTGQHPPHMKESNAT